MRKQAEDYLARLDSTNAPFSEAYEAPADHCPIGAGTRCGRSPDTYSIRLVQEPVYRFHEILFTGRLAAGRYVVLCDRDRDLRTGSHDSAGCPPPPSRIAPN